MFTLQQDLFVSIGYAFAVIFFAIMGTFGALLLMRGIRQKYGSRKKNS